ncbi:hypothetical protein FHX59_002952 [Paraburkholderia silvatlantica]|uniref:Aa3 type cytochrome c oxidase subunit IV n=1 Tax=Paraburkholderia silvatlantica TaxID=321895 RepID=A0ABR6FNZ7_9BURK|nr:hypothetical protein [Paraburkholderia silvatlantica]PVY23589.1 hypothetical protein C7411_12875 [Paraburkholderia silvatlantica]PXW30827.1 hypothetical protein C7413_12775 [Paraburkholderia silvatlantica]
MQNDIQEAEELAQHYRDAWQAMIFSVIVLSIALLASILL